MTILKPISFLLLSFVLLSCGEKQETASEDTTSQQVELTKSQKIIQEAIIAHGGDLYNKAHYAFIFRGNTYQFKNDGNNYEYSKIVQTGDSVIHDVLVNGELKRSKNGKAVTLSEKEIAGAMGSINSVIYFATLPHKLNDPAVHSKFIENISIKGHEYDVVEVTFAQEGGGEDHDDEYYYWINKDTKKVDYLAYNYSVNEGGVRFRSAYNVRVVDGVTFQDYINYGANLGTPLKDLPGLYENEELQELSKIETEEVINLNKK